MKRQYISRKLGRLIDIDDDTGCWQWLGHFDGDRPLCFFETPRMSARSDDARVHVYDFFSRKPLHSTQVITMRCNDASCVAYAHMDVTPGHSLAGKLKDSEELPVSAVISYLDWHRAVNDDNDMQNEGTSDESITD